MKKTVLLLAAGITLLLCSCEVTKEISLQADGGGTLVSTTDMSGMIGMAKMSGGADMEKMADSVRIDTTISMAKLADSIPNLSAEEKTFVDKGMLGLTIDMKEEKFVTKLHFPFTNTDQVGTLDKLSSRLIKEVLKQQMEKTGKMPAEMGSMGELPETSIDDYFLISYSKGLIERKLVPDKYANKDTDEGLKALQQMSSMGMGNTKLIFNLPAPVKKTEGKSLTVSEDKKTVTIMTSAEDFFDNAKGLEFRIEY